MKKIIMSLAMIAAVGALVAGATGAFFSDTETSSGNTFTAGTIDISVDGQNPWNDSWSNYLDKPCQTNYMNFVVRNEGENPANVWKRLTNVINGPGAVNYCGEASSEPEYEAGGGTVSYNGETLVCEGGYIERDNLSAFMIYDMSVCVRAEGATDACLLVDDGNEGQMPSGDDWDVLIDAEDQVRVDNVVDTWVKIATDLGTDQELVVSQSYHLMTWDDSGQPMVTNWAQGDTMEFDVVLEARQIDAPAPGTTMKNNAVVATVEFIKKDPVSWEEEGEVLGSLTYEVAANTFNYDFEVEGLVPGADYSLIYYADPYPGNHPGALIQDFPADASGKYSIAGAVKELNLDLPDSADANYGAGAKLWIVLADDYNGTDAMTAWNPNSYLFDKGLVNYDDLGI